MDHPTAISTPSLPSAFAGWLDRIARHDQVLAAHAVPVQLWLRPGTTPGPGAGDGDLLHFLARGTRLTLSRYRPDALVTLLLRAACDCAQHRTAGATARPVLRPGAEPVAVATYDGALREGWRSIEAALLPVPRVAEIFEGLREELARPGARAA